MQVIDTERNSGQGRETDCINKDGSIVYLVYTTVPNVCSEYTYFTFPNIVNNFIPCFRFTNERVHNRANLVSFLN